MSKIFDMAHCNSVVNDNANIMAPCTVNLSDAYVLGEFGLGIPNCNDDIHSHCSIQFSGNIGIKYSGNCMVKIIVTQMMTTNEDNHNEEIIYTGIYEFDYTNDYNDKLISFNSSIDSIEKKVQSGYYRYRLYIMHHGKGNVMVTGPIYFQATSYLIPKVTIIDNNIIRIIKNDDNDNNKYSGVTTFSSGLSQISPKYMGECNINRVIKSIAMGFGDSAPVHIYKDINSCSLHLFAPEHHYNNFVFGSVKDIIAKRITVSITIAHTHYFNNPVNIYVGIFKNHIDANHRQFDLYKKYQLANISGKVKEGDTYSNILDIEDNLLCNEDYIFSLFSEYSNPNPNNIIEWINLYSSISILY